MLTLIWAYCVSGAGGGLACCNNIPETVLSVGLG